MRGCGRRALPTICSADPASAAQPWRVDLVPADRGARGVARAGARPDPAGAAVRGHSGRPLWAAAAAGLGRHPASARVQRPLLPAALPWPASRRRLHPVLRHRHGARPDGRWRVIDTHTETPAGIGYALANRMVHTNVAGDIFVGLPGDAAGAVLPAAAGRRSPRRANRADPTIALLTPGPAPQRLLQPRLSCPLSRPAARRGRRSARDRRPRLAQDAARPDADRLDRALRGRRRGRPARARRVGLCRSRGAAAGHARAARPRGQCAGVGARREPRAERLSAEARQRSAAARTCSSPTDRRWWLGDAGEPPPCAGQSRPHGHPPGPRGHRPAGPRHPRHRSRAPGPRPSVDSCCRRSRSGARACRRGEGRASAPRRR